MAGERPPRPRVLVVSDDDDAVQVMRTHLADARYLVLTASDARRARTTLKRPRDAARPFAAVVVDASVEEAGGHGGEGALALCRELSAARREQPPAIVLLTRPGSTADRVAGLEAGADDCLAKPFSGRELVLRIAALLRRIHLARSTAPERVALGRLSIDRAERRALVAGKPIALTPREIALLMRLAQPAGFVQSREALLDTVWRDVRGVGGRTIDAYVMRLRDKLGAAGVEIETVHGVGYRLRTD